MEKAESIKNNLKVLTWRELQAKGKFDKNAKPIFISDDMLVLGCNTGSETHYLRALDIWRENVLNFQNANYIKERSMRYF